MITDLFIHLTYRNYNVTLCKFEQISFILTLELRHTHEALVVYVSACSMCVLHVECDKQEHKTFLLEAVIFYFVSG